MTHLINIDSTASRGKKVTVSFNCWKKLNFKLINLLIYALNDIHWGTNKISERGIAPRASWSDIYVMQVRMRFNIRQVTFCKTIKENN